MAKILITGGNSGLGFEVAKLLAARGDELFLLGRDLARTKSASEKIAATDLCCDVRDNQAVEAAFAKLSSLDILVNCAGITQYAKLDEQAPEKIAEIIETNLLGTIYCSRAALKLFRPQKSGLILNVSSTSGLPTGGNPYEAAYVASKYGVTGFTDALRKEVVAQGLNVRVLCFNPGGMKTEFFSKAQATKDTTSFMDPAEVAKVVVFMLEVPQGICLDQVVMNRNKAI